MMEWNEDGLLPVEFNTASGETLRSPYRLTLPQFAERYGGSDGRLALLSSLLEYRAGLRGTGVVSWFQWVNGSFVEDVQQTRGREPEDIDLVTFYHLPDGRTADEFQEEHPVVFDWKTVERKWSLDSYCVPLNGDSVEDLLTAFGYWDHWWSHTKHGVAKGFVRLEGLALEDEEVIRELASGPVMEDRS